MTRTSLVADPELFQERNGNTGADESAGGCGSHHPGADNRNVDRSW